MHTSTGHATNRRTRRYVVLAIATALTAGAAVTATAFGTESTEPGHVRIHDGLVELPVQGGTASIDTATLRIDGRGHDGRTVRMSDPAVSSPGEPGRVTQVSDGARWTYPGKGLTVEALADHGRLRITVTSATDTTMTWPVTGTDPAASALQLPRGEGLSIPVADTFWNSPDGGLVGGEGAALTNLSLPLWGYSLGDKQGVSYLAPTDIDTSLQFASSGGRLRTTTTHRFSGGNDTRTYTVTFALTDGSPIAPAVDYRAWLSEHGQLGSLKRKIEENPETAKLLGAFHAYTWGGARTAKGVERLKSLGVTRMWVGYDSDDSPMTAKDVAAAETAGYLAAPYDSFADGQEKGPDSSPNTIWPDGVYPGFCVQRADGTPQPGFRGHGCYLSSEAFEKAEKDKHYLADRTRSLVRNGASSYFLDVDAAGELFRDHDPKHPMTMGEDRTNRLARMKRLMTGAYAPSGKPLVLGSEAAGAWANKVLAYDHGSGTPVDGRLWGIETGHIDTDPKGPKNDPAWGGYMPEGATDMFFKPVKVSDFKPEHRAVVAAAMKAMYDPVYRVPLYETALHGSLINVERWELPFDKLPEQKTNRALLAMLYNVPLNFVLSDKDPAWEKNTRELAALQKYFDPLHRAAGTQELTSFRWLTEDRTVQRTVFGDGALTVTANFGSTPHDSLPGGCVDAKLKGESTSRRLCPSKVVP
ncbi:glycoside hydrolase [Streptomyces benahoarensis]|uniref:Lipoprotein n=1 Tax=Streptomyces benahoarensis TaxID=2595054 RepID=A0A553Z7P1_9ACTN|nr:glycoside hydrolase [Streptomyces benahoarensis]TSB23079.1 hypothetical protein FNJ62_15610 [Streptomyces benahoarensis]TSB37452.1 hypothetical protein FNZ23_18365 [Streptomyces benahoarensis]